MTFSTFHVDGVFHIACAAQQLICNLKQAPASVSSDVSTASTCQSTRQAVQTEDKPQRPSQPTTLLPLCCRCIDCIYRQSLVQANCLINLSTSSGTSQLPRESTQVSLCNKTLGLKAVKMSSASTTRPLRDVVRHTRFQLGTAISA